MSNSVRPYDDLELGKKQQVEMMFDNIAHRYDLLNHLLSLGIDKLWRKAAIKLLKPYNPKLMLDVATGTADFAIESLKLNPDKVIGLDISEEMLSFGRKKLAAKKLEDKIELIKGDSENMPFEDNHFDSITVAFGVRNFENLEAGLKEMYRVLKPGSIAVILEFSKPGAFPMKQLFNFYFKNILPLIGRMISKDQKAYTYLPESVQNFPEGEDFIRILQNCGYKKPFYKKLTFGICAIYVGGK